MCWHDIWVARELARRLPGNTVTVLPVRAEQHFITSLM
jgi:hypothetical protein